MSILIDKHTKVIVQGFTGKEGSFHSEQCIAYGTQIVGGVTPEKGGLIHLGKPVFNTMQEAVKATRADASMIFVPPHSVKEAIFEAADAGIKLCVIITEGVPILDMLKAKTYANKKNMLLIGPNCPGIITPNECKIGIMPGDIFKKGCVGLISKSGTLTYEGANQICKEGFGISTAVGIGGDPIIGLGFKELLMMFENDKETEVIVLIGEIGGELEIEAATFIKTHITKPIVAFIAGQSAPKGKKMGHAGAIIKGNSGTALEKMQALKDAEVKVVESLAMIGKMVACVLKTKS